MDTTITGTMPEIERLEAVHTPALQRTMGALRMLLGFTFLWAFLDKAFALGFSTGRVVSDTGATVKIAFFGDAAWIHGASPTAGAIGFALKGPFADAIQTATGYHMTQAGPAVNPWIDWVFMLSMLLIGAALMLGIFTRIAAIGGAIWMVIFYTATAIWPDNNPFVDEHLVYLVVLIGIAFVGAGRYLGLGKAWGRVGFVRRHPVLT